jgi:hypothetical protein
VGDAGSRRKTPLVGAEDWAERLGQRELDLRRIEDGSRRSRSPNPTPPGATWFSRREVPRDRRKRREQQLDVVDQERLVLLVETSPWNAMPVVPSCAFQLNRTS